MMNLKERIRHEEEPYSCILHTLSVSDCIISKKPVVKLHPVEETDSNFQVRKPSQTITKP